MVSIADIIYSFFRLTATTFPLTFLILSCLVETAVSYQAKSNQMYPKEIDYNSQASRSAGYESQSEYFYKESYRHYNIECFQCYTTDPNDACSKGSVGSTSVVRETCEDADVNLCYIWRNTKKSPKGDMYYEIVRGCAKSNGNPCNTGPKYESCTYQVCQHDLCNSSTPVSVNRMALIMCYLFIYLYRRFV